MNKKKTSTGRGNTLKRLSTTALQHKWALTVIAVPLLLVLLIDPAHAFDYKAYQGFHAFQILKSENSSAAEVDLNKELNPVWMFKTATTTMIHASYLWSDFAHPSLFDSPAIIRAHAIIDCANVIDSWDNHAVAVVNAVDSTGPLGYTERTLAGFSVPAFITPMSPPGQIQYGSAWMVLLSLMCAAVLLMLFTKYLISRRSAAELEHLVEERTRQLQESSEQYRSLVQNAVVGIFQVSPNGRIKTYNPALVNILRCHSDQDLQTVNLRDNVFVDSDQWDSICGMDTETGQVVAVEVEWRRCDGKIATVRLSGRWVKLGDNQLVCELIAEDITALLRARVAEIEAERLRGVQKLAITVAHEFNNPLSILLGTYQLYLQPNMKHFDPDIQDRLKKMPEAVSRMHDLVLRLLRITRLRENEYIQGTSFLNLAQSTDEVESVPVFKPESKRIHYPKSKIVFKPESDPVFKPDKSIEESDEVSLLFP